jgi:hypothetical protein
MRVLVVAALLAMAWPAAAHAADAGGGTIGRQVSIVSLRVATNGTATVWALVQARCGVGELKRTVTLAPDGSFALPGRRRDAAPEDPRVRRVAALKISGRLVGAVASGTASARLTFRRGGRVVERCTTATRAWQARTPVTETPAGPPRANGAYYGLTSQPSRPHAFTLSVDARARRVESAVFAYRLTCRGGRHVETSNITPGAAIAADGTFSLRERFPRRYANATERFRVKVDGKFTPNGVNGTLSVTSVARSRSGAVIDRCRTGRVTFAGVV